MIFGEATLDYREADIAEALGFSGNNGVVDFNMVT